MKTPRRVIDVNPSSCKTSPRLRTRSPMPGGATPIHSSLSKRVIAVAQQTPDLLLLPTVSKSTTHSRNVSPLPQKSVCISVRIPSTRPSDRYIPSRSNVKQISPPRKVPSCVQFASPIEVRYRSEPRERKKEENDIELREKARKEEVEKIIAKGMKRGTSLGHDFRASLPTPPPSDSDYSLTYKLLLALKAHYSILQKYPKTTSEYYKPVRLLTPPALFPRLTLAVHRLTNLPVVIKSVQKTTLKDLKCKRKALREVANQIRAEHPNVVRLLEVFESAQFMNIVFEYCKGGSLAEFVRSEGRVGEQTAKRMVGQMACGVRACHSQGIVHRELTLFSLLISDRSEPIVKLSDFSSSLLVSSNEKLTDRPSNPSYSAPEMFLDQGYDGCQADLWSLGVVLYAILIGQLPFSGLTTQDIVKSVLKCQVSYPETCPPAAKALISALLNPIPLKRISLDGLLTHSWMLSESVEYGWLEHKDSMSESDPSLSSSLYLDERALVALEEAGFEKKFVLRCVQNKEMNNVTAAYELMRINRTYSVCGW